MNKVPITLAATAIFTHSFVTAQTFDPTAPEAAEIIRESHLNSQTLPDGIAFLENGRMLSFLAADDFESIATYLADESGMSQENAERSITLIIRAMADIEAEIEKEHRRIGCTADGQAKVYGDDVYTVFEQMDDLRESIAEKHLESVKRELGDGTDDLFQQWLDIRKQNTQYVKFDHKKAHERSSGSADSVLAGICTSS